MVNIVPATDHFLAYRLGCKKGVKHFAINASGIPEPLSPMTISM